MFKHFITTTLRHLWRNKFFTALNMLGLSIGISAALVIGLIVHYEYSFDTFQPDRDRIYRIVIDANLNGISGHSVGVPAPLGNAISNGLTGIEQTVPVFQFPGDATANVKIHTDNSSKPKVFKKQRDIVFTNGEYFRLMGYRWVGPEPAEVLKEPFTVVLTESRSRLYFPGITAAEAVGRQLSYNDMTFTVCGIVRDLDQPTDFRGREFASLATIEGTPLNDQFMMDVWNDWMAYSQLFVKLLDGTAAATIQSRLNALYRGHNTDNGRDITLKLQPLHDIHFNPHYPSIGGRIAQRSTLYGLIAVATFLLLLGCINFINLTTARAALRAKEIGVRKTVGSTKAQLVRQFLGETLLVTVATTLLSLLLVPIVLQLFSPYVPEGLTADFLFRPRYLVLLPLFVLAVAFLSGCYPALILSRYVPTAVLKNQLSRSSGQTRHAGIRKALTISQFAIAQFFIMATLIVSKQIDYSVHSDLGFDKTAVFKFDMPTGAETRRAQLLRAVQAIPEVELASTGFLAPADRGMSFTNVSYHNGTTELKPTVQIRWGDENYLGVYGIELIAGRNILPGDSTKELLINAQFAREIGFEHPEQALGQVLDWNGSAVPVVGIMADFHHQSTRSPVMPVLFGKGPGSTLHVRLKPNLDGRSWSRAIAATQKAYHEAYPAEDFNYQFVDEMIAQFYEREQATANLLAWAMGLSIVISCLGLLGLATFSIQTRTKEIGIRKVLGATLSGITVLLSKEFVKLVLIAVLVASPIAWWAMNTWLDDFAYRVEIQWWMFALAGLAAVAIALLTVSWQAIRAAVANPVDSLRDE